MKHGIETPEEWRVGDSNHNEIQELRDEIAELRKKLEALRQMVWWHGIR